jgi:HD superfamily phosphohydrolase YqeK
LDLKEELNRIEDEEIRKFTKECLDKAPPHFWYRPASSTGKYHAKEENESGGLIIHTKRVCRVAEIIIEAWPNPIKVDVIRSACILHDVCKYGTGYSATQHTLSNHPKLGADFIKDVGDNKYGNWDKVVLIADAVEHHMGKWGGTALFSHEDLIVHLADIIATQVHQGGR